MQDSLLTSDKFLCARMISTGSCSMVPAQSGFALVQPSRPFQGPRANAANEIDPSKLSLATFPRSALSPGGNLRQEGIAVSSLETIDPRALASIFDPDHLPACADQEDATIATLCKLFSRFSKEFALDAQIDLDVIKNCSSKLCSTASENEGESCVVKWYPTYGTALFQSSKDDETELHQLMRIGLDKWGFNVHRGSSGHEYSPKSEGFTILMVDTLLANEIPQFLVAVGATLAKAAGKKAKERGENEWTPGFLHAAMKAAREDMLEDMDGNVTPVSKGGFTDVGLNAKRNTAWPLFQAVLLMLMEQCHGPTSGRVLFLRSISEFELFLLNTLIFSQETPGPLHKNLSQSLTNQCMSMLKHAAFLGAHVHDLGHDMSHFVEKANTSRLNLEMLRNQDAIKAAESFKLPSLELVTMRSHCALPFVTIQAWEQRQELTGMDAIFKATASNISWLPTPTLSPSTDGFAGFLSSFKDITGRTKNALALQLGLRTLERTLFDWFLKVRCRDDFGLLQTGSTLPLVHLYRSTLAHLKTMPQSQHYLQAELRSRETLVVWVAFCFVHASSARSAEYGTLVLDFGVALRWTDLHHLVLSDKLARDTCLAVCTYLREHHKEGKGLFDLAAQAPTFDFALRVSQGSRSILDIWSQEKSRHEQRVKAYWVEVHRKQALAQSVRNDIGQLEQTLKHARTLLLQAERDLNYHRPCTTRRMYCRSCQDGEREVGVCESRVQEEERKKRQKEAELKEAEKAPPPLLQNLPAGGDKALQVLFFTHMPDELRAFAELSLLAQERLLPDRLQQDPSPALPEFHPHSQWDLTAQVIVNGLVTSWSTVRNAKQNYSPSGPHSPGTQGSVPLFSVHEAQTKCGPLHVDRCTAQNNGIWYPDNMSFDLTWVRSGIHTNPFSAAISDSQARVCECTEELSFHLDTPCKLQWAMAQLSTARSESVTVIHSSASRGNWAVALQDQRPAWLSKQEFLEFGGLRAYPLQQLRKMCTAIKCRSLPFGQTAVHLLLKQTLFHLGEIVDSESHPASDPDGLRTTLLWKRELLENDGNNEFCSILLAEMHSLVEELKEKVSEHRSVLLLGELASHLAEYHSPFRDVSRACSQLSEQRAGLMDEEIEKQSSNPELASKFRQKRKLMHLHAIACFSNSAHLEAVDAARVVRLMAQVQNGDVLDGAMNDREIDRLLTVARDVLSFNVSSILGAIGKDTTVLTDALKTVVQSAPNELRWMAFSVESGTVSDTSSSVCFFARHEHDVYAINILTGQILFNGIPLKGLPQAILTNELYCRSFGNSNFEVKVTEPVSGDTGSFQTARYIQGRFLYTFHLIGKGRLIVEEFDSILDRTLELLDGVNASSWGKELPLRLQEMHSHWYCRAQKALVLRPVDYRRHEPAFVGVVSQQRFQVDGNDSVSGSEVESSTSSLESEVEVEALAPEDNAEGELESKTDLGWHCMCFEIPLHLQKQAWTSFLEQSAQRDLEFLVLCTSPLLAVFSKFERIDCIHTFSNQNADQFRFNLPRYKLDLELTEGALLCKTYTGYAMEACQQLADTLIGFHQYLLLHLSTQGHDLEGRCPQLILIPHGQIISSGILGGPAIADHESTVYSFQEEKRCDVSLNFFAYEAHPRFHYLQAGSTASRLHLAALYAATSTELPEERLQMTGSEHAAILVRQSWTNAPLTALEHTCLQQVMRWSYSFPMLSLLCNDLFRGSQSLLFLHPPTHDCGDASLDLPELAASLDELQTAYIQERRGAPDHPRRALGSEEERSIMALKSIPAFMQWPEGKLSGLDAKAEWIAADQAKLDKQNKKLSELVTVLDSSRNQKSKGSIDFIRKSCNTAIGKKMLDELDESCALHAAQPGYALSNQVDTVYEKANYMLARIEEKKVMAQRNLLAMLDAVPDSTAASMPRLRLMQAANALPARTQLADLVRFVCVNGLMKQFNPLLDKESRHLIFRATLLWLQWCTLEDKLHRILAHTKLALKNPNSNHAPLVQELQSQRLWNVQDHAEWLVFEVEGRIQIRPRQYEVVKHLLANQGRIVQLNMGEGKTRVILPMLWLYLTRTRDAVVRAHFLSTLLPEAKEYMQRHLSASVNSRRLYFMPFNRDVELDDTRLRRMSASIACCQRMGGMLMIAPEHRLSLRLKCLESGNFARSEGNNPQLQRSMEQFVFRDIFDESDVILHYGYQLVYAVGAPCPLASGTSRWHAAQAILRVFTRSHGLIPNLIRVNAATLAQDGQNRSTYPQIRLTGGSSLDTAIPQILEGIAAQLIAQPPYEFKWMALESNPDRRSRLLKCIVDKTVSSNEALADLNLSPAFEQDVLALRGFLAHGVFVHCMQKRFRVDYGLKRDGAKNLAVPYRAADTPSPRSEFAHPDCQIFLTILSYYFDGLEEADVKRAVAILLNLGRSAQAAFYRQWFDTASRDMDEEARKDLDNVNKLDVSNPSLMQTIFRVYRRNPETINFFLNSCILPQETSQYPQNLRSSAWDLADNAFGTSLGFSGTNDQFRLLPLQVSQFFPPDPELSGTNGKMVQVILDNPDFFTVPETVGALALRHAVGSECSVEWQRVLSFCVEKYDALIDSGGLLAGASNVTAAEYLIQHLPAKFKGVTFFHVEKNMWKVLDRDGGLESKQASPTRTRDTFAFFDESRCRGADLKLRQDAVAVVTVGTKMCKDKLMQAAGRMRQLTSGQRLVFLGSHDVSTKMQELRPRGARGEAQLTSRTLLCWVMSNTVKATADGLLQWADKGSAFFTTKDHSQHAAFDQDTSLEGFYSQALKPQWCFDVVKRLQDAYVKRVEPDHDTAARGSEVDIGCHDFKKQLSEILQHVNSLGKEVLVEKSSVDEECERELEREEEQEEEKEREVMREAPRPEMDWNYSHLLVADSAAPNSRLSTQVHDLGSVLWMLPTKVDIDWNAHGIPCMDGAPLSVQTVGIHWSEAIFVTKNFWRTVANSWPSSDHLRPVDAVWQFASGELLLLSEREADSVLRLLWAAPDPASSKVAAKCSASGIKGHLRHLAFLREDGDLSKLTVNGREPGECAIESLVALQLFQGDTMYRGEHRKTAVSKMLVDGVAELQAKLIVEYRGNQASFPYSDLELSKYSNRDVVFNTSSRSDRDWENIEAAVALLPADAAGKVDDGTRNEEKEKKKGLSTGGEGNATRGGKKKGTRGSQKTTKREGGGTNAVGQGEKRGPAKSKGRGDVNCRSS